MVAFYNEIDKFAAQWLRNLIEADHIAPGVVDERDIRDIEPRELEQYTQCHFFAGIGVWSHALRAAGWTDDRPIWTGSCPCQPFSTAGKRAGFDDERHLWPSWHWLIQQCRPVVVVGEQVASAIMWIDIVSADMEKDDYAFSAGVIPAAGEGAAHRRERFYFCSLANSDNLRRSWELVERDSSGTLAKENSERSSQGIVRLCSSDDFSNPEGFKWERCRDGKLRPIPTEFFPLGDETPSRVGRLRAYGNAIDSATATAFCRSVKDICDGPHAGEAIGRSESAQARDAWEPELPSAA